MRFIWRMAKESRTKIAKSLIEKGEIATFSGIFDYVTKTEIAKSLGINYGRLLAMTDDPRPMRFSEVIFIAKILGVTPRQISDLVHNQIERKKK